MSKKNGKPAPYAVEMRHVATVKPYPANAKAHSEEAVQKLAGLIQRFGFRVPIVVDAKGVILKGHRTFRAALKIGMTSVPVHVAAGLSATEARAWRLADNRVAQDSGWDDDLLRTELGELQSEGFDLSLTGFGADELEALLNPIVGLKPGIDPDDAPALPEHPITVLGDLIVLGAHRLLCGDGTTESAVAQLMGDGKADMVFTDPPYNADYSSRVDKARRKPWGGILNDRMKVGDYAQFATAIAGRLVSIMQSGAAAYWCIDWHSYSQIERAFRAALTHKATIVWDKGHFGLGTYYRTQYELVLFGVLGDRLQTWMAGSDERDVWGIARESLQGYQHPTQKPVELVDLFAGSGTTLIASQAHGRVARLMELDPRYCDVIVTRWEQATGQTAQRPERVAA